MLLLLIWPQIVKRRDFISDVLKTSAVPLNPNAQIDMKKVLFYSEDNKGQPFQLAADKIWEIDSVNKVVQIDYPKGEMLFGNCKLQNDTPAYLRERWKKERGRVGGLLLL